MEDIKPLVLEISVRQNQTVLPRCLQILSRRGFTLLSLTTDITGDGNAVLRCNCLGPSRWHESIINLLYRLVDVQSVRKYDKNEAETKQQ